MYAKSLSFTFTTWSWIRYETQVHKRESRGHTGSWVRTNPVTDPTKLRLFRTGHTCAQAVFVHHL